MKVDSPLPSFDGVTEWLNQKTTTGPDKTKSSITRTTKGRLVLVHFWSSNCETSQINLTLLAELRDHRKREGLRVIAVHVPQSENEMDASAIRGAIDRFNLTEPCALDNNYTL